MRIASIHSHLAGLEHLQMRKQSLWREIQSTFHQIPGNDESCRQIQSRLTRELVSKGWKIEQSNVGNRPYIIKNRVAVELRFESGPQSDWELFARHLSSYVGDVIDVGIEIVPMRSFAASTVRESGKRARNMSTGVPWYEKELYNLIREGRGVPGVPLVIVGLEP